MGEDGGKVEGRPVGREVPIPQDVWDSLPHSPPRGALEAPTEETLIGPTVTRYVDPEIAVQVLAILNAWSYIDAELNVMVCGFLEADYVVVAEMLAALRSSRVSALRGAAKVRLEPKDLKRFNRVLALIGEARRTTRERYAHGMWVYSGRAGGALLLKPDENVRTRAAIARWVRGQHWPAALSGTASPGDADGPPSADPLSALHERLDASDGETPALPSDEELERVSLERLDFDVEIALTAFQVAEALRRWVQAGSGAGVEDVELSMESDRLRGLLDRRSTV